MTAVGDVLNGRYRIEQRLGAGGMGCVYLAFHLGLQRRVAVKEMTVEVGAKMRPQIIELFRAEAQTLMDLSHPSLPRVHDFFDVDDKYYLVMDFIPGRTLHEILQDQGPLPERQVLNWAGELCSVLDYLHQHKPQVIFRDLKPSNIMEGEDGHIHLIDFGLAKVFDADVGGETRTIAHGVGTPGFAAPEHYSDGTDVLTDIYSLGATLYFLLTRVAPPPSVDLAAGRRDLRLLSGIRPDLSASTVRAVERMMALKRKDRPQSMYEVTADLRLLPGTPTMQRVPGAVKTDLRAPLLQAPTTRMMDPAPIVPPALSRPVATSATPWKAWAVGAACLLLLPGAWLLRPHPSSPGTVPLDAPAAQVAPVADPVAPVAIKTVAPTVDLPAADAPPVTAPTPETVATGAAGSRPQATPVAPASVVVPAATDAPHGVVDSPPNSPPAPAPTAASAPVVSQAPAAPPAPAATPAANVAPTEASHAAAATTGHLGSGGAAGSEEGGGGPAGPSGHLGSGGGNANPGNEDNGGPAAPAATQTPTNRGETSPGGGPNPGGGGGGNTSGGGGSATSGGGGNTSGGGGSATSGGGGNTSSGGGSTTSGGGGSTTTGGGGGTTSGGGGSTTTGGGGGTTSGGGGGTTSGGGGGGGSSTGGGHGGRGGH